MIKEGPEKFKDTVDNEKLVSVDFENSKTFDGDFEPADDELSEDEELDDIFEEEMRDNNA